MSEAEKTYTIASNQVPYSMVNRNIENEVVPHCLKENIGILAYSPLQRGLLTGKIKSGHKFGEGDSRPASPYYKEPNLSRIIKLTDDLSEIANERNVTLSQLVLNWTLQQPGITCALAGARNAAQVLDNVKSVDFCLTDEELKKINALLSDIRLDTTL
jgi:aryl-alcohol dehydrogenase-like predicted oxidoreductase